MVFDAHDREEEFELKRAVNDMMSLAQSLAPGLSSMLIHPMREAAIGGRLNESPGRSKGGGILVPHCALGECRFPGRRRQVHSETRGSRRSGAHSSTTGTSTATAQPPSSHCGKELLTDTMRRASRAAAVTSLCILDLLDGASP